MKSVNVKGHFSTVIVRTHTQTPDRMLYLDH